MTTMNGIAVWPAALKGAAGTFDAEATAVAEAATALNQKLSGIAQPWGTDEVGARFGNGYASPAQMTLANVQALTVGLARIAAALRAVADNSQRGEEDLIQPIDDDGSIRT